MEHNLTHWVCERAAANQSKANCSTCTFWQQPDLTRARPLKQQHRQPPGSSTAWFMCLHKPTTASEIAFMDYVRVAITSARLNAPSLAPYVLYMHSEGEAFDPVDDNTTGWLKAMGVHVYNWRLSFLDQMPPRKRWMERSTGICKMDIPLAAHRLQTELAARGLDVERVVMTDVDVLFAGDFTFARWPQARSLPTFAAGIEFFSESLNSGVVYFNVTTFMQERAGMLTYAVARGFNFLVADQSWLQEWFDPVARKRKHLMHRKLGWLRLDETVFNARPFVHPWPGHPRRARPLRWKEPHIWHWHGYKPADVVCWLRAIAEGTWPLRAWHELPGCDPNGANRHTCMYQPIKDSGCRFFGRIQHSRCYLRTYTYLLMQHRRFLRLAASTSLVGRNAPHR